jgi:hypothetical protein
MREAGDPRKDNQILSDGQTKFLELKASAEPRGIAATAAQTTAATGQADSITRAAAQESADFARVANARNQVTREFNDAVAERSSTISKVIRKAKQVDAANEESNTKNKDKPGYTVLPTDTSGELYDKLLKKELDKIPSSAKPVAPTAAPKPATATTPAEQKAAGNAPVPGAYKVGDVVPGTDKNGKPISMKLTQNNKGELVWEPQ